LEGHPKPSDFAKVEGGFLSPLDFSIIIFDEHLGGIVASGSWRAAAGCPPNGTLRLFL